jgi:hypothetical protein
MIHIVQLAKGEAGQDDFMAEIVCITDHYPLRGT